MSQIDQSFAAARSLPISVSFNQVEAMIAAFPMPSTTPLWKSTTMKVAAAGAIGTSAFFAFWPTNDEVPTPEYQPQIQVPIEADTLQQEVQKTEVEPDSIQDLDEKVSTFKLEKPLIIAQKEIAADTDSLISVRPIKPVVPMKPKDAVTPIVPVPPIKPEKPMGLFDGKGGSEPFEDQHSGLIGNANHDDHEEGEQKENCDCDCTSTDVVEWNKHIDTGVMSFFFSCDKDNVELEKDDLKRFQRELKRELKQIKLFENEIRIDFRDHSTIVLNGEKLQGEQLAIMLQLFEDYDVFPSESRKILMDKRQIWVGDFVKGEFKGTARGFNVKKSMADEWLED